MAQKNRLAEGGNGFVIPRHGTVLLVHEEREDLRYYSAILQGFGYQVRVCESYEEGLRLLGSEPFDFIILGQGGPNFEGRCVLKRANQIDRHLPVVVVARNLEMPCYLEAMQLGAVDYLAEPLTGEELGRAVAHLCPRAAA